MLKFSSILIFLFVFCIKFNVKSQGIETNNIGVVKGLVRDTLKNYVIKSATVSIYKMEDGTLLMYGLTNNNGEFQIKNIPTNVSLNIKVSHISYLTASHDFKFQPQKHEVDLGAIMLDNKVTNLREVVITAPPITMNGDTLEFNASAFKLDTNAVVEDLLKKIPNITVWGDGKITVNGKPVKSILVNGKPFFGENAKIATQNIPKNALEKVQVYNTVKDRFNTVDSVFEVNLKLKKGRNKGYFGKFGTGYGLNKRFDTEANINIFTPRLQMSIVSAFNNVNKTPEDIETILNNSTFRGDGNNIEYQSDFQKPGIYTSKAGGGRFEYDFIKLRKPDKKNIFQAEYFIRKVTENRLSEIQATTLINESEKIIDHSQVGYSNKNSIQYFKMNYNIITGSHSLNVLPQYKTDNGYNEETMNRIAKDDSGRPISSNHSLYTSSFANNILSAQSIYSYTPKNTEKPIRFKGVKILYSLDLNHDVLDNLRVTEFKSYDNISISKKFNRKYNKKSTRNKHQLEINIPNLKSLFFGERNLKDFEFGITNKLNFQGVNDENTVKDLDTLTAAYHDNTYLSNLIKKNILDETTEINIEKSITNSLTNRYIKRLKIIFSPNQRYFFQTNKSTQAFQNLNQSYKLFAPDISVSYSNNQYGAFINTIDIKYITSMTPPILEQLAPLIDSSNLYDIRNGNIKLKKAVQRVVSFNFNHNQLKNINNLNYYFTFSVGQTADNIVDSTIIDSQNKRNVFPVNANGNRFATFESTIRKSFKLKSSEIQFGLEARINKSRNPNYINNVFSFSNELNKDFNASVYYTKSNFISLFIDHSRSSFNAKQKTFNTEFTGKNIKTVFSTSVNFNKRITLSSNISFNKSSSSDLVEYNFTLLNANLAFRFLKGNNGEFKISALDILNQNKGIINFGTINSYSIGRQSVLKRYFILTLAYFPRYFGK